MAVIVPTPSAANAAPIPKAQRMRKFWVASLPLALAVAGVVTVPTPAFAASATTTSPAYPVTMQNFFVYSSQPTKFVRPVELQKRVGDHWSTINSGNTASNGKFRFTVHTGSTVTLRGYSPAVRHGGKTYPRNGTTPVTVRPLDKKASLSSKVDAFVARNNGKRVDFDGYYGAQCVDLFNFYNRDVVKGSAIRVNRAYELWSKASSSYIKVSAPSTPRKGDVAIWNASFGSSGGSGHAGIVLGVNSNGTLRVFNQNYLGSPSQLNNISKAHLSGYLRPKV